MQEHNFKQLSRQTGISETILRESYENSLENISDIKIILKGLKRKYNFSECGTSVQDILIFVNNIIPTNYLSKLDADDKDFYQHLTLDEALEIIILRLLNQQNRIVSKNDFPEEYNFLENCKLAVLPNGKTWIPYINDGNYDMLLISIKEQLNVNLQNGMLLFHGTCWESAMNIMESIRTNTKPYATDFGMNNFYTTNDFYHSVKWARHNSQPAVVIFYIPNEILNNLITENISDIQQWKETVFKCRNPPKRSAKFREQVREYELFLEKLDSKDLVIGPIFSNPRVRNQNEVQYINGENVPLQFSFKESSVEMLNQLIATTLFFNEQY